MYNFQAPLEYFDVAIGHTSLSVNDNQVELTSNSVPWMGLDLVSQWQTNEFVLELSLAYGDCITTGLGLGIVQTMLALNPNVRNVRVFEKNRDVIEIFKIIAAKNNFDVSKIQIINADADKISNQTCDCLFLDHFENISDEEIISRVRNLANFNSSKLLWYWPAASHFVKYCLQHQLAIDEKSYVDWKHYIKIPHLPNQLTEKNLIDVRDLKKKYLTDAAESGLSLSILNLENRQHYKKFFKKFKGAVPSGGL